MPEFRFRRKKQNRRTTVANSEETANQIQEARKLVKPVFEAPLKENGSIEAIKVQEPALGMGGFVLEAAGQPPEHREKRNSFVQEREKFFELLKTKYPEQAISLEVGVAANGVGGGQEEERCGKETPTNKLMVNGRRSGDPESQASDERSEEESSCKDESPLSQHSQSPPTSSSRFGECLYLRHGKSLRHCPMPSPVTLSTIKNLYINLFELSPSLLTSPSFQIYVQDKKTMQWDKLHDISMITDHCTLLLADSALSHTSSVGNSQADSDINMPLEHLTPSSLASPLQHLVPTKFGPPQQRTSNLISDGHHSNLVIDDIPTPVELPKTNGLWRSGHSYQAQDLSVFPDHAPLQKNPPSLLINSYPTPTSTTPSSNGSQVPSVDKKKLQMKAQELQNAIKVIKSDISSLRQAHSLKAAELEASFNHTSQRILAAVSAFECTASLRKDVGFQGERFRAERLELYGVREGYDKCCKATFKDLNFLESAVENLRTDVVDRRCKVVESELNSLTKLLNTVIQSLKDIKRQFLPLDKKTRQVMEAELKSIVKEEKFLEREGPRLEEASEKCDTLMKTLLTLLQVASVQSRRTPHIPHYQTVVEPDRAQLMDNIMAIIPNHTRRLASLSVAEGLWEKKKTLHSENQAKIKEFENVLKARKEQLHKAVPVESLDSRREMKLKALYMEDKFTQGSKKRFVAAKMSPGILKKGGERVGRVKEAFVSQHVVEPERRGFVDRVRVESKEASEGCVLPSGSDRNQTGKNTGWRNSRSLEKEGNGLAGGEAKSQEALQNGGKEWKAMGVRETLSQGAQGEHQAERMEIRVRDSRSQEEFSEHGGVREGRSQELSQVEPGWTEHSQERPREDILRQGWGRGVASQEMSQEGQQPSLLRLERVKWRNEQPQSHSQPLSHSQPESYSQPQSHSQPLSHSQPESYSQPQVHSQPEPYSPLAESRSQPPSFAKSQSDSHSQPETHSQPEYHLPVSTEAKPGTTFVLTPPTKSRRSRAQHTDYQEGKRKSIGDAGDLIKVERYYDTLERKRRAANKKSGPALVDSRGVAQHQWGGDNRGEGTTADGLTSGARVDPQAGARQKRGSTYEDKRLSKYGQDHNLKGVAKQQRGGAHKENVLSGRGYPVTSENSISSSSMGSSVTRPSCLKSSSMLSTSTNASSVEPAHPFTSSGSSVGGLKISPLHKSHRAGSKETNRSAIPRFQKATSQGTDPHGEEKRHTVGQNSRKPQLESFPARYGMRDYRSKKSETPSPPNSPIGSKRSKKPTLTKRHTSTDTSSDDGMGSKIPGGMEQRYKHVVVSHSDAPFHGTSYLDSNRSQRKEVREIFDGDTLPVRKKDGSSKVGFKGGIFQEDHQSHQLRGSLSPSSKLHAHQPRGEHHFERSGSGRHQNSLSPSRKHERSSTHPSHSSHHHQQNMQLPYSGAYSQHLPSALKKQHKHPHDVPPSHAKLASHGAQQDGDPQQQSKRNRVQFQPEHHHDSRPHPLLYKSSGIPMRATKSAQTPGDSPLTSYPRSHTHALQQRSASNGRVQLHTQGRLNPHQGVAYKGGLQRQGFHHHHYQGAPTSSDRTMPGDGMMGSLV